MDFGSIISGIGSALGFVRSSVQAGKDAWNESMSQGGNFWQNLGSGLSAGFGELFTGEHQEQKELQSTIDAEQRAMENTRQLRDEENAYNDPAAQAARYRAAGINPLSAMSGGPQAASNTTVQSSGGQRSHTEPAGMSQLLPFLQLQEQKRVNDSIIAKNEAQTGKLTVDTAIAEWDVKLKQQLFTYNAENYPILLQAGMQKLENTKQEYKNLVAKEDYDKAAADELRMRAMKEQEEIYLLQLQYYAQEQRIQINDATLKQMAQDLETGKFEQEYAKWHAKHEKALARLAITKGKITDAEWHDLWESGLMKSKTEEEKRHIQEMADKLSLDNDIWETGKTGDEIFPQVFRRVLYLLTEII